MTSTSTPTGSALVKRGLADLLRGGVIMDVVNPEQARIAEDAGAVAVMALERVPSDIRRDGGVARMSDPQMIQEIQATVTIPVMAKARIGHFAEARVLEALDQDLAAAFGSERGVQVREGFKVALAGPPNAGKSSLFNSLINRDAAIVTPVAGTTRDVIEADLILGGYLVRIADTAGLRETDDLVEIEGIRRAQDWAAGAGLRLWLADATLHVEQRPPSGPEDWRVFTHADLADHGLLPIGQPYCFAVDARHRGSLADLIGALSEHVVAVLSGGDFPAVTRQRHREILSDARAAVRRAIEGFGRDPELVGEDVRLAARSLERLTGRIGSEDVLDEVFRSFCIGK